MQRPLVAIVGRPNVGKSTLFNRLIGRREALALDERGVTRDRHYGDVFWDGYDFICVDTGGFVPDPSESIQKQIQSQIEIAVDESDLLLFVVDGRSGLSAEDQIFIEVLRKKGKVILPVVNKIDSDSLKVRLGDFYGMGLGDLYPVSAEHGGGVSELLTAITTKLPKVSSVEEAESDLKIAIVGRPNVGKSTLVNQLAGTERVVVDSVPGTTRDVVVVPYEKEGRRYLILDTAGIRRKGHSSVLERITILMALKAVHRAHVALLLLDASETLSKQDGHVAGYIEESWRPMVVVINKWDLVPQKNRKPQKFTEALERDYPFLKVPPKVFISAREGKGLEAIWEAVEDVWKQYNQRISTSHLNEEFEEILDKHPLPVFRGKTVKIYYATQTDIAPPTFTIFCNDPQGIHFSYKRFLINELRERFGFGGSPLRIQFRRRS